MKRSAALWLLGAALTVLGRAALSALFCATGPGQCGADDRLTTHDPAAGGVHVRWRSDFLLRLAWTTRQAPSWQRGG